MNREETEAWLNRVPVLSEPSDEQAEALRALFGSVGLTTFLGLLLGARQALYAFMSNVPLGDAENDCAAAVVQGKIRGIELVFDTVREQSVESDGRNDA